MLHLVELVLDGNHRLQQLDQPEEARRQQLVHRGCASRHGALEGPRLSASLTLQEPAQRPSMQAVLEHPVWWPPERQLSFLCDLSDRVELLDGDAPPSERPLLISLEAAAQQAIGGSGQWCDAVDGMLLENLGRFRRYSFRSLRDLLRVIRNKNNHFQEMPQELQELMGPLPSGFVAYFTARFPNLVLTAWLWGIRECAGGPPPLDKYFDGASDAWLQAIPEASLPATKRREVPLDAAAPPSSSQLNVDAPAFMLSCPEGHDPSISAPPSSLEPPPPVPVGYPLRPGEKVCSHYQRTGQCNFGEDCIFHHPPFPEVGVVHPVRPHEPICTFYLRTGGCQFGLGCRFHHPPEKAVARNSDGTPVRPVCSCAPLVCLLCNGLFLLGCAASHPSPLGVETGRHCVVQRCVFRFSLLFASVPVVCFTGPACVQPIRSLWTMWKRVVLQVRSQAVCLCHVTANCHDDSIQITGRRKKRCLHRNSPSLSFAL